MSRPATSIAATDTHIAVAKPVHRRVRDLRRGGGTVRHGREHHGRRAALDLHERGEETGIHDRRLIAMLTTSMIPSAYGNRKLLAGVWALVGFAVTLAFS